MSIFIILYSNFFLFNWRSLHHHSIIINLHTICILFIFSVKFTINLLFIDLQRAIIFIYNNFMHFTASMYRTRHNNTPPNAKLRPRHGNRSNCARKGARRCVHRPPYNYALPSATYVKRRNNHVILAVVNEADNGRPTYTRIH